MVARRDLQSRRLMALSLLAVSVAGFALATTLPRSPSPSAGAKGRPGSATEDSCLTLTTRLCGDVGAESSACRLARTETARFATAHCAGMLTRYSQVLHELEALDVGVRALTASEQTSVHGAAPSVGSPAAPLTLVEFCDFESPDCARASPIAHMLPNLYADRVRLVFRQYPSERAGGRLAAEASLAAQAQGKFWEYHDVLFSNPQDLSRPALERYAAETGLDLKAFRDALDEHTFADDVTADIALGHGVQALDRPSLFANGKRVPVPYGAKELATLIETELGEIPRAAQAKSGDNEP